MSSSFALTSVKCVLQQQEDAGALSSLGWLISSFIGRDPIMLREACMLGSTALLDWIWRCSCTFPADRPAEWSLSNYLRSDQHYRRFEFAEAAKVAARRGDLPVMRWLFAHSPKCDELASVIAEAASEGHLEVLRFLMIHLDASCQSVKMRKAVSGDELEVKAARVSVKRIGLSVAVKGAIRHGHYTAVRWLFENGCYAEESEGDARAICRALDFGGTELAEVLLLPDNVVKKYTDYGLREELVEPLLRCCRDGDCAARAMRSLSKLGRLDLMQQVAQLHHTGTQAGWAPYWQCALENVSERDNMAMIQWLMVRPYWNGLDAHARQWQVEKAFSKAAEAGSVAAMDYLHSHELAPRRRSLGLMERSIHNGQLDAVKWFLEHGWHLETHDAVEMIDEAAKHGQFEMMQFFQDRYGLNIYDQDFVHVYNRGHMPAVGSTSRAMEVAVEKGNLAIVPWLYVNRLAPRWTDLFDIAAVEGNLDIVQWLHENWPSDWSSNAIFFDRPQGFGFARGDLAPVRMNQPNEFVISNTIRAAAAHGHFEVVRWMHSVRPLHSIPELLDSAVQGDYMELVQWIHENTTASGTSDAMVFAARKGNLTMLKWLYTHRTEGCTAKAMENALGLDDIRVSSWLVKHFPALVPRYVTLSCQLDMLIFVRAHFPQLLEPERFRQGTTTIRSLASCSAYVRAWLKENYGGQTFRSTSGSDITF